MTGFITILTTTPTEADAERIAETLLSEGMAACVQIAPVRSRYVWKGKLERADELLLLIKTRELLFDEACGRIRTIHPYDTPEVVALPITAGDGDYLAWLAEAAGA